MYIPLLALLLLTVSSGSPTYIRHEILTPLRTEPTRMMVSIVCQHRATIETIIELFEAENGPKAGMTTFANEAKRGECIKFPEEIDLPIEEYTTLRDIPVEHPQIPSQSILFEAVRVRNLWTILQVPVHST